MAFLIFDAFKRQASIAHRNQHPAQEPTASNRKEEICVLLPSHPLKPRGWALRRGAWALAEASGSCSPQEPEVWRWRLALYTQNSIVRRPPRPRLLSLPVQERSPAASSLRTFLKGLRFLVQVSQIEGLAGAGRACFSVFQNHPSGVSEAGGGGGGTEWRRREPLSLRWSWLSSGKFFGEMRPNSCFLGER